MPSKASPSLLPPHGLHHRLEDPRFLALATTAALALAVWTALGVAHTDMGPAAAPALRRIPAAAVLWLTMMLAMMLPAMAPVIAAYAEISRRDAGGGGACAARVVVFGFGYFLLWGGYALAAAGLQLALRDTDLFRAGGTVAAPDLAAGLLIAAGVYQWSPVKDACLRRCRSPLAFLLAHWRPGLAGAFRIGVQHGWFCLGCCVALMSLMFVLGTMALWGMAAIAAYCVAERILPGAERWGRGVGATLVLAGLFALGREYL